MHNLQKILLKRLSLQNNQRYGTLTHGYNFYDNIVFHLKQLLLNHFIVKEKGVYIITPAGIKEISKYDSLKLNDKGVKTFFIGFLCRDKDHNYLIKAHPGARINFYNLPCGKPYFGES